MNYFLQSLENSKVQYRIEYNSNNKVEDNDDALLSFAEYEKLYPNKNLEYVDKYLKTTPNPKHSKAIHLCEIEMKTKPLVYKKGVSGYIAYCVKCGKQEFPKNDFMLKEGSSCCHVEYTNERPHKAKVKSQDK